MTPTPHIEAFLRNSYSDENLIHLLEAAEHGELRAFDSHHCLLGLSDAGYRFHNKLKSPAKYAESEFFALCPPMVFLPWKTREARQTLNQRMIPLIQAEITRRAHQVHHTAAMVLRGASPVLSVR